jgi:hypothetical protein
MHVRAREEDPDTELSRVPELPDVARVEPAPPATEKAGGGGRRAVLALLVVITLAAVVVATGSFDRRGSSDNDGPSESSSATIAPRAKTEPAGVAAEAKEAPDTAAPAVRANRGWIHVVVQPWGNVWIDGVWMGRAPVKARVSKGRHIVEVGRELPSKKRVVQVEAGARKDLEISLID